MSRGQRKKKFDDPIYILRLPRGAGCWIEFAFEGTRVTLATYAHGVVSTIYPPATWSLGEFCREFVKLYPRYGERLADIIADEDVW